MLEKHNKYPQLSTEQILRLKIAVESQKNSKEEVAKLLKEYGFEGEDPMDLLFELLDHLDKEIILNKKSHYHHQN